jgi:hypothetical protein
MVPIDQGHPETCGVQRTELPGDEGAKSHRRVDVPEMGRTA